MWVSNEKDHTVSVIDTNTMEVKATYNVGLRPRGITFAKDYSVLYICASDDDPIREQYSGIRMRPEARKLSRTDMRDLASGFEVRQIGRAHV